MQLKNLIKTIAYSHVRTEINGKLVILKNESLGLEYKEINFLEV